MALVYLSQQTVYVRGTFSSMAAQAQSVLMLRRKRAAPCMFVKKLFINQGLSFFQCARIRKFFNNDNNNSILGQRYMQSRCIYCEIYAEKGEMSAGNVAHIKYRKCWKFSSYCISLVILRTWMDGCMYLLYGCGWNSS